MSVTLCINALENDEWHLTARMILSSAFLLSLISHPALCRFLTWSHCKSNNMWIKTEVFCTAIMPTVSFSQKPQCRYDIIYRQEKKGTLLNSIFSTCVHACSDSASLHSSQAIIVRGRQCIVGMNGWIVVWTSQVPQLNCLYQWLLHMETLSIAGQVIELYYHILEHMIQLLI